MGGEERETRKHRTRQKAAGYYIRVLGRATASLSPFSAVIRYRDNVPVVSR